MSDSECDNEYGGQSRASSGIAHLYRYTQIFVEFILLIHVEIIINSGQ